jgi:SAM-dependent methyltransferase
MGISEHARKNRDYWDRASDEYQARHGPQLNKPEPGWGVWDIPERELNVLGEVSGRDILELGCGGAQWSIRLAKRGARPVGLDNSEKQLTHARRLMAEAGIDFPLVHASAEAVPLPDRSFDIVFCDHGAMGFCDPARTVPEAARLLRPGGLLAFNLSSPLLYACWDEATDAITRELRIGYFEMGRFDTPEGGVDFQLPQGEWVRLFRRHGFVIEDLIELRPPEGATTTYAGFVPLEWARRWPAENIWKARKL